MKNFVNYLAKVFKPFIVVLMLFGTTMVYAQQLKLDLRNVSIKSAMEVITSQSGYTFVYSDKVEPALHAKVILSYEGDNIAKALEQLFQDSQLEFNIQGKNVALNFRKHVIAQKVHASDEYIGGTVKDAAGEPLSGVIVNVKGKKDYAASDIDGNYNIVAGKGDVLVFTMVGFKTVESAVGTSRTMNIVMQEDVAMLDDVVVTGYQTISKERSAGSYVVVTTDEIENKLKPNIMDRLEGMVSGLQMYKGKPVIRGTSTLYADKSPLYVVDGVPFEGDIDMINPNDIVNVSVLKDATAASIYGARSTNGVIVITTRTGQTGKLHVSYSGTVSMQPLPDRGYLNKMSSGEFVEFQRFTYEAGGKGDYRFGQRYALNDVYRALLDRDNGVISGEQCEDLLEQYKHQDRYGQLRDMMNKVSLEHQHNLSFNGGSDFYRYSFSLNYTGTSPYDKGQYTDRIGFNIKNNFNFAKWFQADVSLMGNMVNNAYDNGFSMYRSYMDQDGKASYYMLKDEAGNPMKWEHEKSREELERLHSVGLYDQSYYPILEQERQKEYRQSHYITFNMGLRFNIIESLNLDLRYQTELGSSFDKTVWTKDSFKAKDMVNDATVIRDGEMTHYIPVGGQDREEARRSRSYTLRAQINYNDTFAEKHNLTVLAGAERRKITKDGNVLYRYGYDDDNLSYGYLIDEAELRGNGIRGTQAPGSKFTLRENPSISSSDDRYISFYANASYTYNDRLNLNASIRMDQSNLFGTDPKYQYKPLWSAGASYQIFKAGQKTWIDRLAVRATYGINGNVYKESGPYIIAKVSSSPDWSTFEKYSYVIAPPNSSLRWEKTRSLNLGVDFSFLRNRLGGSIDFYNKKTDDMIGNREFDPTVGWEELTINYAAMRNRGVEVVLESVNIDSPSFRWETSAMFSYNKNEITKLNNSSTSAQSYYEKLQTREGKPYNAMYGVRYAGLNEEGKPMAYKKDGSKVFSTVALLPEDLVYMGTYDPPFSASMNNTLSYKGFDLSFMFIYYGGHIMRDIAAAGNFSMAPISNFDRLNLNMAGSPWSKDDIYTLPAFTKMAGWSMADIYKAADIHKQHGDYIKLRDISLSYNFPADWIRKVHMQNLKITFQAQNVWTWTANKHHLDPEVWQGATNYPSRGFKLPASYVIGLNINF